jgi:NADH-quinone oxidoreductase subunit M
MVMGPLLSVTIFLPAVAGVLILFLPRGRDHAARRIGLAASLASLFLSLAVAARFDPANPGFQFVEKASWIPSLGISYQVGVDGISLFLILLTAILTPIAILASWRSIQERVREFHAALLFLTTGILGVFASLDLALFYVFWEVMLIPMYLLIGIWGSGNRVYAAVKFFLYTMVGSLLMLLGIIYLYLHLDRAGVGTFELTSIYRELQAHPLPPTAQLMLFLAFGLSFAIKVPLFPFHTWLPDAHTEAPTAGSVILAGVLLKMGTYGFIRFAIPFFPAAAAQAGPWIVGLSVVGIIYGACMCLQQDDLKRLIAYSSVSHLGFVMLGIFALNPAGLSGGIYQMLNHGVSTGALFLLVGSIYERAHTRRIADYGGLARTVPRYATVFMIVLLSSIGLPGLNGFVGEFWILLGGFQRSRGAATLAATGLVLGAVYMLTLYQRMMFGKPNPERRGHLTDLDARELSFLVPLLALMVLMGMASPWFTARIDPAVASWLTQVGSR